MIGTCINAFLDVFIAFLVAILESSAILEKEWKMIKCIKSFIIKYIIPQNIKKSKESSYMITLKELHKKTKWEDIPEEHQKNLLELLERINKLRKDYGKPMIITSGYRSLEDHLRIYKEKGIADQSKIPMKSRHLYGKAVDISDPNKELQTWCLQNIDKLEQYQLWCEDFSATPNWVHFQSEPPKSGKRFFIP